MIFKCLADVNQQVHDHLLATIDIALDGRLVGLGLDMNLNAMGLELLVDHGQNIVDGDVGIDHLALAAILPCKITDVLDDAERIDTVIRF